MNKIPTRPLRIVAITLTIGMCMLVCGVFVMQAWYGYSDIREAVHWRDKTSPLDPTVINDICLKFGLSSTDTRCQPGAQVYAPDFFGTIRETFAPSDGVWATYEEVQQKLEQYQFAYDPPVTTGDGLTYFRAHYDLRGDRVYPIIMFFYADGRLWRIIADTVD